MTASIQPASFTSALQGLLRAAMNRGVSGASKEAIVMARAIAKLSPACAAAWYLLGILHREQGQAFAAAIALRQCLVVDANNAHAHLALGEIALKCGARRVAHSHLRRAIDGGQYLTPRQRVWAAVLVSRTGCAVRRTRPTADCR